MCNTVKKQKKKEKKKEKKVKKFKESLKIAIKGLKSLEMTKRNIVTEGPTDGPTK